VRRKRKGEGKEGRRREGEEGEEGGKGKDRPQVVAPCLL